MIFFFSHLQGTVPREISNFIEGLATSVVEKDPGTTKIVH